MVDYRDRNTGRHTAASTCMHVSMHTHQHTIKELYSIQWQRQSQPACSPSIHFCTIIARLNKRTQDWALSIVHAVHAHKSKHTPRPTGPSVLLLICPGMHIHVKINSSKPRHQQLTKYHARLNLNSKYPWYSFIKIFIEKWSHPIKSFFCIVDNETHSSSNLFPNERLNRFPYICKVMSWI